MGITSMELLVIIGGTSLIGLIYYYFFGPKKMNEEIAVGREGNNQTVTIVVDAGYTPEMVKVKKDIPVEVTFDRRDKGECTEWVVFEKLPTKEGKEIKARLPEGEKTIVRFTPTNEGAYQFVCGMGMVHGKLIVSK